MLIRIPPKYSVSAVMGYIKGKSAIRAARDFMGRDRSFKGYHFWARGYFVSTVGIDERTIREYICHQEKNDRKTDQQRLF
jgi:putative transposase